MVFHWSLSNSKSPQSPRTILSILAVLSNAVGWMVSTRPPDSESSSPFNNPLVTVPKALITIGIIVTFMLHRFFKSQSRLWYLSFFSHSFSFILFQPWHQGWQFCCFFFVFFLLLLGLVLWLRSGDPYVRQSSKGVYVYHFLGQMLDFIIFYHLPILNLVFKTTVK